MSEINPFTNAAEADEWIDYVGKYHRRLYEDFFATELNTWLADVPDDATVLDIGCGEGVAADFITQLYIGVEPSERLLTTARENSSGSPLREWLPGTATNLPLRDASIEAAFSVSVLLHVADLSAAFSELARTLKPGGRFFFIVPNPTDISMWERLYYDKTLDTPELMIGSIDTPYTLHNNHFYKHSADDYKMALNKAHFDILMEKLLVYYPKEQNHIYWLVSGVLTHR